MQPNPPYSLISFRQPNGVNMYANRPEGLTINFGTLRVYINASHVCVRENKDNGKFLFQREKPMSPEWYDEKHTRIVKAIQELEQSLISAAGREFGK